MNRNARNTESVAGISGPFATDAGRRPAFISPHAREGGGSACATARARTDNLPYALWGATLLLCALCFALSLPGHRDAGFLTGAAPGFTIPAPHVGAMRVIPEARGVLLSPCAAWEAPPLLAEAGARL